MRKKGSIEGLLWAEKMKQRGKLAIERMGVEAYGFVVLFRFGAI